MPLDKHVTFYHWVKAVLSHWLQGACWAFLISQVPALDRSATLSWRSRTVYISFSSCSNPYTYSPSRNCTLHLTLQPSPGSLHSTPSLFTFPRPNSDSDSSTPYNLYNLESCPTSYFYHFKSCSSSACMCVHICVCVYSFFLWPINLLVKCNLIRAELSHF